MEKDGEAIIPKVFLVFSLSNSFLHGRKHQANAKCSMFSPDLSPKEVNLPLPLRALCFLSFQDQLSSGPQSQAFPCPQPLLPQPTAALTRSISPKAGPDGGHMPWGLLTACGSGHKVQGPTLTRPHGRGCPH